MAKLKLYPIKKVPRLHDWELNLYGTVSVKGQTMHIPYIDGNNESDMLFDLLSIEYMSNIQGD